MSGVFGISGFGEGQQVEPLLGDLARRLRHRDWHRTETFVDERAAVGLGQAGIGIFNREGPALIDDGMRVAAMAGMLFDADTVRRDLERRGCELRTATDVELLLALYRDCGAEFCSRVAGEFVVAVWDRDRQELVVANDRFGFYPTYYGGTGGRLAFAPEMKPLLRLAGIDGRLDRTALAQYVTFQCLLGERTFFDGLHLLPCASVLRLHVPSGALEVHPYWKLSSIVAVPRISFEEAVEESGRLLSVAVNRTSARGYRTGLYLTGGLDSRLLLGLFAPAHRPVTTFTFGQRRSRDVTYARRLARIAGADHHWTSMDDGAWVAEWAPFHLLLTEGQHGWIHAHGISTLPDVRTRVEVAMTGWDGGTVIGAWLNRVPALRESDDVDVILARQFELFRKRYTWPGLDEGEHRVLFTAAWAEDVRDRAFDSLREEVLRFMDCRDDLREEFLYVRNHCRRMTGNMPTFLRSYVETCSPFFDFDLFRFVYSLPARMRGYKLFHRALLQKHAPALCWVPDARSELAPTTRERLRQAQAKGRKLARTIAGALGRPPLHTLYADYERYLRTDLQTWGEEILLGPRTLGRGIFNPALLRSLWQRMQSGREPDIVGKLQPLMSYELMLRHLVDD